MARKKKNYGGWGRKSAKNRANARRVKALIRKGHRVKVRKALGRPTAVRGCACASGGVKTHLKRKSPFGKSKKRVTLCRSKATGVWSRKVRCHG